MPSLRHIPAAGLVVMLLAVTAAWGWTFLIVKDAVAGYPVVSFLALRFVVATIALTPFVVSRPSRRGLGIGTAIGVVVAAAYLAQTAGLTKTSAASAGLLTGLFVILTPLCDRLLYRSAIAPVTWFAIFAGFAGTILLTFTGRGGANWGDLLEVLTAVGFALQIVWLGHHSAGRSSTTLAFGQMAPSACIFTVLAVATQDGGFVWPSAWVWFAIALTGLVASAVAFWVQTFVQQRMAPSRAALILLSEPAFATLFAVWLGGERLSAIQWLGAVLIFVSLLTHEGWLAWQSAKPGLQGPAPSQAETPRELSRRG